MGLILSFNYHQIHTLSVSLLSHLSHLMTKPTKWHVRAAETQISLGIRIVWSVFAVRMKKAWVLSYPLSAQRRPWSDWVDAQADLSLGWAHSHFVGFVMRRLKFIILCICTGQEQWPGNTTVWVRNWQSKTATTALDVGISAEKNGWGMLALDVYLLGRWVALWLYRLKFYGPVSNIVV